MTTYGRRGEARSDAAEDVIGTVPAEAKYRPRPPAEYWRAPETSWEVAAAVMRRHKTGRCPVCGEPAGIGMTCGSRSCQCKWLFGRAQV